MKIFNWVHRRFHQKYEISQDVKKAEVTANVKDNLSLLENAGMMDNVFDGWKEGILAIGTFGFDPSILKEFDNEDDVYLCDYTRQELSVDVDVDDDDDDDDENGVDQEEEIEFPLVFKACKHGFFHDQKDDDENEILKTNDYDQMMKKGKKVGERITLADLFWADSDKNLLNKKLADDQDQIKVGYSPEFNTKHASAYDERVALISKKKITKDDAARPIKKINRMVRKMLKKKIHPDIENQKDKCAVEAIRVHGSLKNA